MTVDKNTAISRNNTGVASLSDDDNDDDDCNKPKDDDETTYTTAEPGINDVLCGRGGSINSHPGNERFRILVEKRKRVYLTARFKREKRLIAGSIVSEIRNLTPRGRFLTKDTKNNTSGLWKDIGYEKSRDKTSQALRENAPTIRAEIEIEVTDKNQHQQQQKGKSSTNTSTTSTTSKSVIATSQHLQQLQLHQQQHPPIAMQSSQHLHQNKLLMTNQQQQQQQQQHPTMIPVAHPYYAAAAAAAAATNNNSGAWMYPFYGYMHPPAGGVSVGASANVQVLPVVSSSTVIAQQQTTSMFHHPGLSSAPILPPPPQQQQQEQQQAPPMMVMSSTGGHMVQQSIQQQQQQHYDQQYYSHPSYPAAVASSVHQQQQHQHQHHAPINEHHYHEQTPPPQPQPQPQPPQKNYTSNPEYIKSKASSSSSSAGSSTNKTRTSRNVSKKASFEPPVSYSVPIKDGTSTSSLAAAAAATTTPVAFWPQSTIEQTAGFVTSRAESFKNWTKRGFGVLPTATATTGNLNHHHHHHSNNYSSTRSTSNNSILSSHDGNGGEASRSVMTYKHSDFADDTKKRRMVKFRDDDTNSNFSTHRVRGRRVRPCYSPGGGEEEEDEQDDEYYDENNIGNVGGGDAGEEDPYRPLNENFDNNHNNNNALDHRTNDNFTFIAQLSQLFAPTTNTEGGGGGGGGGAITAGGGSWDLSHICGHDTTDHVPFPSSHHSRHGTNTSQQQQQYNTRDDYYEEDDYEDPNDNEIEWEGQEVQLVEEKKKNNSNIPPTGQRHYTDDRRYPPEHNAAGSRGNYNDNASASLAFSSLGSCHSWIPEHFARNNGSMYDEDDDAEEIITSGGSTTGSNGNTTSGGGTTVGNKSCSSHDYSSGDRSIGGSSLTRVFDTHPTHNSNNNNNDRPPPSPLNMNHKTLSRIPSWERRLRSKSPLSLPSNDEDDNNTAHHIDMTVDTRTTTQTSLSVTTQQQPHNNRGDENFITDLFQPLSPNAINNADYFDLNSPTTNAGILRLNNSLPLTDDSNGGGGADMVF